jgi:hypothetical protein
MNPVKPPKINPFCFPLPPLINPPIKSDKNEMIVTNNEIECSSKSVKRRSMEKIRLAVIAISNMVITP